MKLFQTIQKNLTILKFDPNQPDSFFALIFQHWSCFLKSFLSLTSLIVYLLHDANTVKEYMDSLFLTTAAILIFVSFTSTVFKTPEIYIFFNGAEKAANKSECDQIIRIKIDKTINTPIVVEKNIQILGLEIRPESEAIYIKISHQVELLSKIVYFSVVNIFLPAFLLPLAILSYFRYFFTDLGNDAFMLTVPTW